MPEGGAIPDAAPKAVTDRGTRTGEGAGPTLSARRRAGLLVTLVLGGLTATPRSRWTCTSRRCRR